MITEQPPVFFPFDDPQAAYIVTKNDNLYFMNYVSISDKNKSTICEDINGKQQCKEEINRGMMVMIGKSDIDLKPYIGKKVKIDGDFVYAKEQCIAQKCVDIGSYAVLDIQSIKLAN